MGQPGSQAHDKDEVGVPTLSNFKGYHTATGIGYLSCTVIDMQISIPRWSFMLFGWQLPRRLWPGLWPRPRANLTSDRGLGSQPISGVLCETNYCTI